MAKYRFDQIAINSTEKKKPVEEDRFTYLGLEHLDSGSLKVTRYGSEVAPIGEKLIMRKGDVLFGKRRAYQKKVAIAPFDGIFSAHGMVLRPREDVIDKDFFPLFISSDYFLDAAIKISVGSLSPTINWRDLKELEFELPDLDTQRRLAAVLWAMNETMDSYKELIAATDELVKSQFMELMSGATERRIADVCLQYGRGKTPSYVDYYSKVRVINQACIYWDGLRLENVKYQNEVKFKTENTLKEGAVLLNATGTGTLGRSYIFQGQSGIYMADGHVSVFYTKEDVLLPRMLQVFFSLPSTQDTIYANCVSGTTNQIELSKEKIGEVMVPVPEIDLQKQYVAFVEQSDKSKLLLHDRNEIINQNRRLLTCLMKTTRLSR